MESEPRRGRSTRRISHVFAQFKVRTSMAFVLYLLIAANTSTEFEKNLVRIPLIFQNSDERRRHANGVPPPQTHEHGPPYRQDDETSRLLRKEQPASPRITDPTAVQVRNLIHDRRHHGLLILLMDRGKWVHY